MLDKLSQCLKKPKNNEISLTKEIQVFTIKRSKNIVPLEKILLEFGENIPLPCAYDGCPYGLVDLCCADMNINVKKICKKYDCICDDIYIIKVDISEFNSDYMIVPVYQRDPPYYRLTKK